MSNAIELGPYTEGVNLVDPPTKLNANELSLCRNWRIGVRGDLYKRPGHGNYGNAPAKINGNVLVNLVLRYYRSDGSKLSIAAAGGKLRFGNDVTGAWTDISINGTGASMSASNLADWMVYKNRVYITDGVAVQRYNGTDDIFAGCPIPGNPTLTGGGGGGLTPSGIYKYFVTYVAGDMGEGPTNSPITPVTITLTSGQNSVTLTNIPVAAAKHEVSARKIYRTKAGGSLYYLLTTINDNSTTTYADFIIDTSLNFEYVPTVIPPANARYVIMGHDERAYWFGMPGVDASLVRVSDVGFPDRVINNGIDGFFSVSNNDGDLLTGGGLTPGGIVFFKKNSMWLLRAYGFGLVNIQPREKKGSGVGTTSPFSVVTTPIGMIFVSQQGRVYRFDGTNIEEIGRKISSEFLGMTQAGYANMVACFHNNRYSLSYDYRGTKGYNWRTLEYDIITNKWEGPHENGTMYTPSYYSTWDSVLDKGELAWGEARAAGGSYMYIRTEFTSTDRGTKFLSLAETGKQALGQLAEVKSYKVFVHAELSSDARLTITHIDDDESLVPVTMNSPVPSTAAIYNTSKYNDGSDYAGRNAKVLEGSLGPCRARTPRYRIDDGGTATVAKVNNIFMLASALPLK